MSGPAIAAAVKASKAASDLLEIATEGGLADAPVAQLTEALALSIDLHLDAVESCDTDYRTALTALRDQADTFLERWCA